MQLVQKTPTDEGWPMDSAAKVFETLARIEAKIDRVLEGQSQVGVHDLAILKDMTTKQHAALQMIVGGLPNSAIAEAMDVSINTAKVHVRHVAAKLGLHTRAQITRRMGPVLDAVDADLYRELSGGLPKSWCKNGVWGEEDVEHVNLYR